MKQYSNISFLQWSHVFPDFFVLAWNAWHVIVKINFSWLTQCDDQDASIKYFEHSSFASKPCKSKHNAVSIWNQSEEYFQEQITTYHQQDRSILNNEWQIVR